MKRNVLGRPVEECVRKFCDNDVDLTVDELRLIWCAYEKEINEEMRRRGVITEDEVLTWVRE